MNNKQITAAVLSMTLLLTGAQSVLAASTTDKKAAQPSTKQSTPVVHTLANLPVVKITAKSTVRLTDVNLLTMDEESVLTYTLTIQNNDSKSLDLLDYWSKLKTVSGTTYTTSLMTKDKEKKKLSAGSSTTLTYVAKVAKGTKFSNLIFEVVKWDFNQPNYESKKGQFKIPDTYLTATPANQSKTLRLTDVPVKAKVNQVASYVSGDYNYVSVALDLQNIGYKLFEDPKVKFSIKPANGAIYPMSADSTSVDYRIQPQDTKTLNLMTAIPKSIDLKNMELQLIQEDETAKLSLPIATMQLPSTSNKSLATDVNTEKSIAVGNGKLVATVKNAWINQSFDEHDLSIQLLLKNSGGTTAILPKYQFELNTSDGYRLPIEVPALENLVLQPLEERYLTLHVTVPANIKVEDAQLFMNLPAADESKDNFKYPVGIFALPKAQPMQNIVGQKQFVQTSNGIIGISLSSLQRLPWSDGDLVSAKITISNTSFKTMKIPDLVGQLKVDSAKLGESTKLITTQSVGLLGANMSTDLYVVSKVPSYLDFSQLQISLLEKIGDKTTEWMQFSNYGPVPGLASIAKGETYTLDSPGKTQDLKVLRTVVYSGTTSDIIYTELELKNTEKNPLDLSKIAGSYRGSKGQTYKAQVNQIDSSVGPDEKSVVALWSKIPKSVTTSDIKLVVGEAITDDKLTAPKEDPTGYVNAAALELAIVQPSEKSMLSELEIFPYKLTVKNVRANLTGTTSVNVSFEYNMTKDMGYTVGDLGHKYLFEVVDSSGRTFEKEFTPETDLKVTNGGGLSFSIDDAVFENRRAGSLRLNVYDLFEGQKVKLGSQGFYYTSIGLNQ